MANLSDNFKYLGSATINWSASSGSGVVQNIPVHFTHKMKKLNVEVLLDAIQDGGGGLRVVKSGETSDQNLLNLKIKQFNTTTGEVDFIVKIPDDINQAGAGAARTIDFWGNNSSSQPSASDPNGGADGVTSNGFKAYVPASDSSSPLEDITAAGDDFVSQAGSPSYGVDTPVGPGVDLEASNSNRFRNSSNLVDLSSESCTITGVFTSEALTSTSQLIVSNDDEGGGDARNLLHIMGDTDKLYSNLGNAGLSGNTVLSAGQQYHGAVVYDHTAGTLNLYLDGVSDATQATGVSGEAASGDWIIGSSQAANQFFDGILKNITVSNVARSAEFVEAMRDLLFEADTVITSTVAAGYLEENFEKTTECTIDWGASPGKTGAVTNKAVTITSDMMSNPYVLFDALAEGAGGLRVVKNGVTDYNQILNIDILYFDKTNYEFAFKVRVPDDINKTGSGAARTLDFYTNTTSRQPAALASKGGQFETYGSNYVFMLPFHDAGDSTITDRTANQRVFTNVSSVGSVEDTILVRGAQGATNCRYEGPDLSAFLQGQSFTLMIFEKKDLPRGDGYLFAQGYNTANDGLHFGWDSAAEVRGGFWSNDLNVNLTVDHSLWRHLVLRFDDDTTNTRTIFENGVQVAQDTPGSGIVNCSGRNFALLRRYIGGADGQSYFGRAADAVFLSEDISDEFIEAESDLVLNSDDHISFQAKPLTTYFGKIGTAIIDWTAGAGSNPVVNAKYLFREKELTAAEKTHLFDIVANGGGGLIAVPYQAVNDSTIYNIDIRQFDTTLDQCKVWIKIPSDINRNSNGNVTVKVDLWGRLTGTQPTPNALIGGQHKTWADEFDAVWHLDETSGNAIDATGHNHIGDDINTVQADAAGEIWRRRYLASGNSERFHLDQDVFFDISAGGKLYMSGWFELNGSGSHMPTLGKTDGGEAERNWLLRFQSGSLALNFLYENTSGGTVQVNDGVTRSTGVIYHAAARIEFPNGTDPGDMKIYVDGSQTQSDTSTTLGPKVNGDVARIGYDPEAGGNDQLYNGEMEQVVFKKGDNKTAEWQEAEFDLIRNETSHVSFDFDYITGIGIESAEAWGMPIASGSVILNSIPSAEAFGLITQIDQEIRPNGIESAEAFGTPGFGREIRVNSIESAEAFGSPQIDQQVRPNSIESAEAFGSPQIDQQVRPSSIESGEAIGILTLKYNQWITTPTGIVSEEAFGELTTGQQMKPRSIESAEAWGQFLSISVGTAYILADPILSGEAWGSPSISGGPIAINPNSILSAEAWGTPGKISLGMNPESIETAEAWGSPSIAVGSASIQPNSIETAEAWGSPSVAANFYIQPNSIGSAEVFGEPQIVPGVIQINPEGIATKEGFGEPGIIASGVSIAANSIDSGEAFGLASLVPQFVSIHPNSILSAEAWGSPSFAPGGVTVSPDSIDSVESFGLGSLIPGNVFTRPASIQSAEEFGFSTISVGGVDITPNGIVSGEVWGSPSIGFIINPESIESGELFGSPSISGGGVDVAPEGIFTGEAWGDPILRHVLILSPESIAGAEAFGNPKIIVRVLSEFQQLMEQDLDEGFFVNDFEFAEAVTFIYENGESFELKAIFDEEYEEIDPGSGVAVMSRQPMIQCQSSKFKRRPKNGSQIIIRGVNYDVKEYEPDGTGVTSIRLHMEKTV